MSLETTVGKLEAIVKTRGGSKSPELVLLLYKNRWITPYEQRRHNIWLTMSGYLSLVYSAHLSDLVYSENPLLQLITDKNGDTGGIIRFDMPVAFGKDA